MPLLEGVDGRSGLQNGLWQLGVVEADAARDRLLEPLARAEAVALQSIVDPAVEALDHAVGSRPHRGCEALLDVEFGAEAVEVVVVGRGVLAQAEKPVGELPCRYR